MKTYRVDYTITMEVEADNEVQAIDFADAELEDFEVNQGFGVGNLRRQAPQEVTV